MPTTIAPPTTCCPAAPVAAATAAATVTATPALTPSAQAPATLRIEAGYRPGFLARTLQMHMDYYYSAVSWGQTFEAELVECFGKIVGQLPSYPDSQIWSAVRVTDDSERIVGTIILDSAVGTETEAEVEAEAEAEGGEGKVRTARLRGFSADSDARGLGAGKKLLAAAMAHVEERGIEKVILHTTDTLGAAVYLYQAAGFVLHSEEESIYGGQ